MRWPRTIRSTTVRTLKLQRTPESHGSSIRRLQLSHGRLASQCGCPSATFCPAWIRKRRRKGCHVSPRQAADLGEDQEPRLLAARGDCWVQEIIAIAIPSCLLRLTKPASAGFLLRPPSGLPCGLTSKPAVAAAHGAVEVPTSLRGEQADWRLL